MLTVALMVTISLDQSVHVGGPLRNSFVGKTDRLQLAELVYVNSNTGLIDSCPGTREIVGTELRHGRGPLRTSLFADRLFYSVTVSNPAVGYYDEQ